ncbi:NTRK3 factor, partial [Polypterus senegalus]
MVTPCFMPLLSKLKSGLLYILCGECLGVVPSRDAQKDRRRTYASSRPRWDGRPCCFGDHGLGAWKLNPVGARGHRQGAPQCLQSPGPHNFRHTQKCWGEKDRGHQECFRVCSRHFRHTGGCQWKIAGKHLEHIQVSIAVGLAGFACVLLVVLFVLINKYGRRSKFGMKVDARNRPTLFNFKNNRGTLVLNIKNAGSSPSGGHSKCQLDDNIHTRPQDHLPPYPEGLGVISPNRLTNEKHVYQIS